MPRAAAKSTGRAVGAGLVARAEDWRWSGLWARNHGDDAIKAILSPWPVERQVDWIDRVNAPLSAKELARLRRFEGFSGTVCQPRFSRDGWALSALDLGGPVARSEVFLRRTTENEPPTPGLGQSTKPTP